MALLGFGYASDHKKSLIDTGKQIVHNLESCDTAFRKPMTWSLYNFRYKTERRHKHRTRDITIIPYQFKLARYLNLIFDLGRFFRRKGVRVTRVPPSPCIIRWGDNRQGKLNNYVKFLNFWAIGFKGHVWIGVLTASTIRGHTNAKNTRKGNGS